LDKLPQKRRKLTGPEPEEELPAEFSPLQPQSKKKDYYGRNGKILKIIAFYPFVFHATILRSTDGR
jgi:hypothetical protein